MARSNEPVRPVIVKKVYEAAHDGHHGGAWKVAYADFVTAMMAFFLLMWLIGATTEKQRKALADYFSPTLVETKNESAGSDGFFGGDSIISADQYPHQAAQTGTRALTIPRDAVGGPKEASGSAALDDRRFQQLKKALEERLRARKDLLQFRKNIRFTDTRDGLRMDLVDEADFTMFFSGTDRLTPSAQGLLREAADAMRNMPNGLIIRGHTDAMPYVRNKNDNNWRLSSDRADATRAFLLTAGIPAVRFTRIEGVADQEPYRPQNPFDPSNRRMSITFAWSQTSG